MRRRHILRLRPLVIHVPLLTKTLIVYLEVKRIHPHFLCSLHVREGSTDKRHDTYFRLKSQTSLYKLPHVSKFVKKGNKITNMLLVD